MLILLIYLTLQVIIVRDSILIFNEMQDLALFNVKTLMQIKVLLEEAVEVTLPDIQGGVLNSGN